MSTIEKWAERAYAETDFCRSIATSLPGILGLAVYLHFSDWVIAAFASIIFFPVARLVASSIHARVSRNTVRRAKCNDGRHMNNLAVSGLDIESRIRRELLSTSMTADEMRETFVLDTTIFDVGVSNAKTLAAL